MPKRLSFWNDKRCPRPEEAIGGGYIVARRGRGSGRYRMIQWPFEHASKENAMSEAKRLAERNPGRQYVVLQQVSDVFSVPEEGAHADEEEMTSQDDAEKEGEAA